MTRQAAEPLLPLNAIIYAFVASPTIVAALLALSFAWGLPLLPMLVIILPVAVVPPGVAVYLTWRRSHRRNELLTEMAKYRESLRDRAPSP